MLLQIIQFMGGGESNVNHLNKCIRYQAYAFRPAGMFTSKAYSCFLGRRPGDVLFIQLVLALFTCKVEINFSSFV